MGLCFGVRDALAAARAVETPAEVTVLGRLVHNPVVTRELERRGFATGPIELGTHNPLVVDGSRPRVLITAHGVSDRRRAQLAAAGKDVLDTTCPLVRKAHAAALGLARDGCFVVVVGKPGHVEVCGLVGDLPAGGYAVVERPDQVRPYDAAKIGVIAQTTALESDLRAAAARVRAENPAAAVRVVNTVCQPTRDRQRALEALLARVDLLVVVGGRDSNNTGQLVARALAAGVRAVHVEGADELDPRMVEGAAAVGLTAGTSTLPETVAAVRARLREWCEACAPATN
jgi:4-hydroxy-3-methylbut-2-enyl diphosphate reductase